MREERGEKNKRREDMPQPGAGRGLGWLTARGRWRPLMSGGGAGQPNEGGIGGVAGDCDGGVGGFGWWRN